MAAFRGTPRFKLRRLIGRGGMGVVWEAFDEVNATPVALKKLPVVSPDLLLRFKREFRLIADIRHPNLVRLRELILEEPDWFFTMDLVHGTDLVRYVRGAPAPPGGSTAPSIPVGMGGPEMSTRPRRPHHQPEPAASPLLTGERLRPVLSQLARALGALHDAGFVHRDVKPSNVLVTLDGHVVLLDFGLVSSSQAQSTFFVDAGTPEYMAPEQVARAGVTTPADWYAFGTVLFELLTGRLPFEGMRHEIQYHKQHDEPPTVGSIVPDAPTDLAALCNALLSRDPHRRPTGRAVLAVLAPDVPALITTQSAVRLVGRDDELREIEGALAAVRSGQGARALLVRGESGVGKSTLVRSFLEVLRPDEAVVLAARCYERELVPFKAVDGLVDALTRVLRKPEQASLETRMPPAASLLLQTFPVLGTIETIARAPQEQVGRDPWEVRISMFGALRALLALSSERSPIVAFVDDLQWADADSLTLLSEILRPPNAPRVLLLGTIRTDGSKVGTTGPLLAAGVSEQQMFLRNLGAEDARALARDLLRHRADPDPIGVADLLARESEGHPLFLLELVRSVHLLSGEPSDLTLDGVLRTKIGALSGSAIHVLQLLAIAGAPTSSLILGRAAALEGEETVRRVDELHAAKLIYAVGDSSGAMIDIAHDRIRHVVRGLASADKDEIKNRHKKLAEQFKADMQLLRAAEHWREAGESGLAADEFASAALRATDALAFDRAAEHFQTALNLGKWPKMKQRELRVGLAEALSNLGRGKEAAEQYLEAAKNAEDAGKESPEAAAKNAETAGKEAAKAAKNAETAMILDLLRRGAEELIRSGRLDQGREVAGRAMESADLRFARSPVLAFLWQRAVLRTRGLRFRQRTVEEIPANHLARIDLCWSLSFGLGPMDPVQGAHFQVRGLLLALGAGEPYRIVRGIACEAAYMAAQGDGRRSRRLGAVARQIASGLKEPHAAGILALMSGVAHHLLGEFDAGLRQLTTASQIFRDRCVGMTWELDTVRHFTIECLYYLGELPRFATFAAEGITEANNRGSVYAATTLRTGLGNAAWLLQDDPARARDEVAAAMRDWTTSGYHIQHWYALIAQMQIDLYNGDGDAAHARVEEGWPLLRRSHLLQMHHTRIVALHLRGRAALAAAESGSSARRKSLIRQARSCALRLWREGTTWSRPLAAMVRAGASHLEGDARRGEEWLRLAINACGAQSLFLFKAAAQMRARDICGDLDASAAGERWMLDHNVRAPSKLARALFPGVIPSS